MPVLRNAGLGSVRFGDARDSQEKSDKSNTSI